MIILKESKNKIDQIIQMSDIHIPNDVRETEYREVFDETYLKLKIICANKYTVIVIVGDLLHNGRLCSPNALELINDFIHNLTLIAPTIIIPGNHDQKTKKNFLSVIHDWSQYENWYLLEESGAYLFHNIIFGVTSVLDKNIYSADKIEQEADYKIALFHGSIIDYEKKESFIHKFNGYDYVLLGDIHSFQYVDEDKTAAYCGSLIEQNFRECQYDHGFIKWDLKCRKSEFIPITNNYGHRILDIVDGEITDIDDLPKNLSIRYTLTNTSPIQLDKIMNKIRKRCIINEFVEERPMYGEKNSKKRTHDIDVTALESQVKQVKMYLSDCAVDREEKNMLVYIHRKIHESMPVETEFKGGHTWKLLELKFSNMLSYGKHNIIDFTKYSSLDIIGLNGPNQYGKSAVIEILLFCLFEKYSKSKNLVDIMNKSENRCQCSVKIQIGDNKYYIKRVGELRPKFMVDITFCKNVDEEWINLAEGLNKVQLRKKIELCVGNYEDFIVTFFYCQRQDLNLINMTNMQRIKYLLSILKLDIFEEYFDASKKILSTIDTKMSKVDGMMTEILRECGDVGTLRSKIKTIVGEIDKIKNKKGKIEFDKKVTLSNIEDYCEKKIEFNKYCTELGVLKADLMRYKKDYAAHEEHVASHERLFLKRENYRKYNDMMHHSRLPYELMIGYLPKMNSCMNDFLSKYDKINIEYASNIVISSTGKYEVSASGGVIGLYIEKDGNSINLSTVTGFGRFIASMSIKYGMGMIMKNVRPLISFCDEGWDCLDSTNLKNVEPILSRLKMLYECVVVISHLVNIQNVMTKVVKVKKKGGRSYVSNVDK